MKGWGWVAAAALLAVACRTPVRPIADAAPAPRPRPQPGKGCQVNDYRSAVDVPAGSTNIGWVTVPRGADDDETFEQLRQAICAKGGNALSQAHWNRPAGSSVADPPAELEANAWLEP